MKKELNKYLNTLTEKELIEEVKKLYKKFDSVKKYYELELGDNPEKVLSEYKSRIKKEYFPSRGYGHGRSSVSRKIITEFRKISIHSKDLIELMLYRTEMMLDFTNTYGDINESFYNSIDSSFEQACKLIEKNNLKVYFKNYCEELVGKSNNSGWGISDTMNQIYERYFG